MLLTLEELKTMAPDLTGSDEALSDLIAAASALIEARLGRRLEKDDYDYRQLLPDGRIVLLPAWPVDEVRAVRADGQAVADWLLDGPRGVLLLPLTPARLVEVEYTGGVDEIPAATRQAAGLTVLAMSRTVENSGQTLMSERLGDYQEMYYNSESTTTQALSPAAEALIAPWRARR